MEDVSYRDLRFSIPLSSILNLLSVALLLKIETYKRISLVANYFQDHHTAVRR